MLVLVAEKEPSLSWLLLWVRSQLDVLDNQRVNGWLPPAQDQRYRELRAQERELLRATYSAQSGAARADASR